MYYISKTFTFEAAHFIPDHPKCGKVHGHSWKVEVTFSGEALMNSMLVDFHEVKEVFKYNVLPLVDHTLLNDYFGASSIIPTAEELAHWIFYQMTGDLYDRSGIKVHSVKVWETADNMAMYMED